MILFHCKNCQNYLKYGIAPPPHGVWP